MTALDVLAKGGPMMWGVLLCSLLTVYALLECILVFRKTKLDTAPFMLKVRSIYRDGDADGVVTFCLQKATPAAKVVLRGMLSHGEGEAQMRESTLLVRHEEESRLKSGVRLLLVCGIVAPLWGVLSVCVSVFFLHLPTLAPPSAFSEAGSLPWLLIPPGISIAVSLVALAGFAYFSHRSERIMLDLDRVVGELFGLLAGTAAKNHPAKQVTANVEEAVVAGDADQNSGNGHA
jgi:biopolymer transport protein ExbB